MEPDVKNGNIKEDDDRHSGNFWVLEMFLCMIILWSSLFIKSSHQKAIIDQFNRLTTTKTNISIIAEFEEKAAGLISEIL